jgi:lipoate-protein ligase B
MNALSKSGSMIETSDHRTITKETLQIIDGDLIDYRKMLRLQLTTCKERQSDQIPDTIFLVEHPAVITLGARQSRNKLLLSRSDLTQKNIDVVEIRRGGGTTAHNPGQLVIYPILNLQQAGLCIREYIKKLETVGAELLKQLNVNSTRKEDFPGLWVEGRKIASIGVRVSRLTTYHGMAINIHNDLTIFDYIVPCGLENVEMTSVLKETGTRYSMTEVKNYLTPLLKAQFSNSR